MLRRSFLQSAGLAGLIGAVAPREQGAQEIAARATRGLAQPKIRNISVIETQPAGVRLTVVKITTDQDGLYGYGCATFTQRADLVRPAVEKYLKPLLTGKTTDRIEDIWQTCYDSSYWKNGPVLNNAISGIDQALWDIKGRQAGMSVYQLVGGKCREAAQVYRHARGAEPAAIIEDCRKLMAEGTRFIHVGGGGEPSNLKGLHEGPVFDPAVQARETLKLFATFRKELGEKVGLGYDVHERFPVTLAVQFCKQAEQFDPYFIEDPLSPEDLAWFRNIRQQCATPIAMGELFNSPHEWQPLISERLIDYIRVHVSQSGGFTPARKIALLAEEFGVRTAWHGPGDVSPVGHAANLTLDVTCYNFGIQEWSGFNQQAQEIFKGCPVLKDGYAYVNERPGWGIEVDEKLAAKFPFGADTGDRKRLNGGWGEVRLEDGTVIKQ
jgi:mannonate dehydratase